MKKIFFEKITRILLWEIIPSWVIFLIFLIWGSPPGFVVLIITLVFEIYFITIGGFQLMIANLIFILCIFITALVYIFFESIIAVTISLAIILLTIDILLSLK